MVDFRVVNFVTRVLKIIRFGGFVGVSDFNKKVCVHIVKRPPSVSTMHFNF